MAGTTMSRSILASPFVAAGLMVVAACEEPRVPSPDLSGSYVFRTVNGQVPPLSLAAPSGCSRRFEYAVLSVYDSVSLAVGWRYTQDCRPSGGQWLEVHPEYNAKYARTDGTLLIAVASSPSDTTVLSGASDGTYITLVLPDSLQGLDNTRLSLRFGPRVPFEQRLPSRQSRPN
jgi:hypothetical protein